MQTLHFKTSADFRDWLEKNQTESDGIWLRIFKKDSHEKSLSYAEALDQALCYGWIDGQKKPFDKLSWLQTPQKRLVENKHSTCRTSDQSRNNDPGRDEGG
jgi:uncharacterized protein YdeI (YjbR/CyaY-like superfamily)